MNLYWIQIHKPGYKERLEYFFLGLGGEWLNEISDQTLLILNWIQVHKSGYRERLEYFFFWGLGGSDWMKSQIKLYWSRIRFKFANQATKRDLSILFSVAWGGGVGVVFEWFFRSSLKWTWIEIKFTNKATEHTVEAYYLELFRPNLT